MNSYGTVSAASISFGPFALAQRERLLLKNGAVVSIGSRALDLLIALTNRAGEVVNPRDLIEFVWPDANVEEANLRVQITALRKVLGDSKDGSRYIANVSGRGYVFIAPVRHQDVEYSRPIAAARARSTSLPARHSLVGRNDVIDQISELLLSRRFVSIVGPGGIGKTSVAVAVAHDLVEEFDADSVYFVDLGALTNPADIPRAVASALNRAVPGLVPEPYIRAFLAEKRILIVLDCCEHVIDAAAIFCEGIFRDNPSTHLLITSREALRVEGENVYLITPLAAPPDDDLSADQALLWPAVQLFVERAALNSSNMQLDDADAPVVAEICRRLDGMALSIELVAGRVSTYGIRGTADLLNSGAELFLQGKRSALPRHQSLNAMLDWSFKLLSTDEQKIFSRLSVFLGRFTLEAALAVAKDSDSDAQMVANAITSLIDKSLIRISSLDGPTYYRLLDSTRNYAAAKLREIGEAQATQSRHAGYFAAFLRANAPEASIFDGRNIDLYAPHIENIRSALSWSFSESGDISTAVDLTVFSSRLLLEVSLFAECQGWCRRALGALTAVDRGTRRELELHKALAISSMYARGHVEEIQAAFDRALEIAEILQDSRHQIYLYAGLHVFLTRNGDFRNALDAAKRSAAAAERAGSTAEQVMAQWILGPSHLHAGYPAAGLRHCELGFKLAVGLAPMELNFFGYDQQVRARVAYVGCLWLCGFQAKACKAAIDEIREAISLAHPVSCCIVLIYSAEILLLSGDHEAAVEPIEYTIRQAEKYSLAPYRAVGLAFKGQLATSIGDAISGVEMLREALSVMHSERYHLRTSATSCALAMGLCRSGQVEEARSTIDHALKRAQHLGETRWLPALFQTRGEVLQALSDEMEAEESFMRAIRCAQDQSAPSSELRAAIPLAKLWSGRGRKDDALALLEGVWQKFPEVSETKDLIAGRKLLNELRRDR
jgi:predicted ATPase/DNA-binding winged helix-turn-helix (wHTH) protein